MAETLRSTLHDFDKSFFYINFMKPVSGENYVTVEQTMANNYRKQKIKIKVPDLPAIISTLQAYQNDMVNSDSDICNNFLSVEQQELVIGRYLKGISVDDLALQFDCTPPNHSSTFIQ